MSDSTSTNTASSASSRARSSLGVGAWDARAWFAFGALVVLALVSLVWLVHPWYDAGDETNDASIYIACTKSILNGEGYAYLGMPFSIRPPGFSLLIAPIVAWRGLDFEALNLFVSLFGVACVALLFVHCRARLGNVLAFVVAAAVWLNDGFRLLCNQVMSDVPGAALLVGCLLLERWTRKKPSVASDIALAIAIGASAYVRSIVVLLVPAILIARIWARATDRSTTREPWLRVLLVRLAPLAIAVWLVALPWNLRNAASRPTPPADQNFLYSYSTAMWHTDGGDPSSPLRSMSEIAARVPVRIEQLLTTVGARMGDENGAIVIAIGALFLVCTLVVAWRRREPAEIFALIATGVVLVYFGYRARLALPIWLLALPCVAECALLVARRFTSERVAITCASIAIAVFPLVDFHPRRGWDRIERDHRVYTEAAEAIDAALAPDARVAAPIGWHYAVFLDRPVHSLFFAMRRSGGPDGAERVIDKYSIDTVILSPFLPADRGVLPYFQERYGPGVAAGSSLVFRVRRRG